MPPPRRCSSRRSGLTARMYCSRFARGRPALLHVNTLCLVAAPVKGGLDDDTRSDRDGLARPGLDRVEMDVVIPLVGLVIDRERAAHVEIGHPTPDAVDPAE